MGIAAEAAEEAAVGDTIPQAAEPATAAGATGIDMLSRAISLTLDDAAVAAYVHLYLSVVLCKHGPQPDTSVRARLVTRTKRAPA